ncbi:MAG: PAS domain S-box protein [Potamolinea sp.]
MQQPNNKQLKNLKSAINRSKQKSEELRLLQSLTLVISEAPDFDSALCVALRQVCELTNWDYGEAWIPCPDNAVLECSPAWYGKKTSFQFFRKESEKLTFPANIGLPGRVWASKHPEWISDISAQPEASFVRAKLAQVAELNAGFGVPILVGNRVLAVLTFCFAQSRKADKRWVELVAAVAMQLGLVMQRKQLEEELHQERDFSKILIETSSTFFVAIDTKGKTIMMNQGFLKAVGYTLEEVLGSDYLSTFIPEVERERVGKIFEKLVSLNQSNLSENHVLTKDNRELLIEWRKRPIFTKNGELDFFFGIGIDITARRMSEKESARLASIALLSPHPIVETDVEGKVLYLNPEAMRLLPELQEIGAEHPFLVGLHSMAKVLQNQGSLRREVKIDEVYYEQVLHYIPQIECIRIYAFDITERKQAEEQLIYSAFYRSPDRIS